MGLIIHLNGFPGTGKLPIARKLAPCLEFRGIERINITALNVKAADHKFKSAQKPVALLNL